MCANRACAVSTTSSDTGLPQSGPPAGGRSPAARGDALGLAATPEGGDVLVVEAARLPGVGRLRVTGTVGPMVTESANVALTWVRSNADRLAGLGPGLNDATDVHVHLGEAARSKES